MERGPRPPSWTTVRSFRCEGGEAGERATGVAACIAAGAECTAAEECMAAECIAAEGRIAAGRPTVGARTEAARTVAGRPTEAVLIVARLIAEACTVMAVGHVRGTAGRLAARS